MAVIFRGLILLFGFGVGMIQAETAGSFSYPVQEILLAIGNTNRNVNVSSSTDYLVSAKINGTGTEKWYLHFVSAGVFEIANSQSGNLITNDNGVVKVAPDANGENQRWQFKGVENDYDGYVLYYKVVSNSNTNNALTFKSETNSFGMEAYTGTNLQKFKVNLNGLEGFAANSVMEDGKEKAGTIGGLFGETITVTDVSSLKTALASTDPKTIVINGVFDMRNEAHTRIRDNKTIIGSYSAKTLQDCFLRTNNEYGTAGDNPSDNIVFRNIDFQAVNVEDRILVNIWSSRQIWFDHCTFNSKLNRAVDEVGKFIWINTPYLNYMDAKDNGRSPDYITISYCTFTNRFWTVAYGTQNSETRRDRTTLMYNKWDQCVRRTPQLGNGIAHVYNNLYLGNDNGNDQSTTQIIAGDGAEFVSQYCRFQSLKGKEIAGGSSFPYRDDGSYTSTTSSATPGLLNFTSQSKSTWQPQKANYGYSLISAYNQSNTDTKVFCQTYAGAFNSYSKIRYINDPTLSNFVSVVYPTPFLKDIVVGNEPLAGKTGAVMDTTHQYVLKNVNSSLWLNPNNGNAVQGSQEQVWSFGMDSEGYYHVYTTINGGNKLHLGVVGATTDNGAGISLQDENSSDGQYFKLVAKKDGSYLLTTKVTHDESCLGVAASSKTENASVVQWGCNGSVDQNWIVKIKIPALQGELIQDLMVQDTANYKDWRVAKDIQIGDSIYGDRNMTYTVLPEELIGSETIQTACDSKNSTTNLATFKAGAAVKVYVAMDQRVTVPAWLSSWDKTTFTVKSSSDVVYDIYETALDSGEILSLGSNGQSSNAVNYILFAVPYSATTQIDVQNSARQSFPEFRIENGVIQMNSPLETPAIISIYDLTGKLLISPVYAASGKKNIPIGSTMQKGVYIIRIEMGSHKQVKTLSLRVKFL